MLQFSYALNRGRAEHHYINLSIHQKDEETSPMKHEFFLTLPHSSVPRGSKTRVNKKKKELGVLYNY